VIDRYAPLKKKIVKGKFTPLMTPGIADSMKNRKYGYTVNEMN
jgi:hypothetical protein